MSWQARPAGVPIALEALEPRRRGQRLVGHVERNQGQLAAAGENNLRGVGVDVDVELGRRGHVATLGKAAAHHDDFPNPGDICAAP